MKATATKLTQRQIIMRQKQRRVMTMQASFRFRLAALCAIDNTVSENVIKEA